MAKYLTLPQVKEATQWFPDKEVAGVITDTICREKGYEGHARWRLFCGEQRWMYDPHVITIHQQRAFLSPGDYVVTEPDGVHHYPVKAEIFEAHHRIIEDENEL